VLHELEAGASLSATNAEGFTPAHLAAQRGREGCLRALHELEAGASLSMAKGAILALKDRTGSSRQAIKKYLNFAPDKNRVLTAGLAAGVKSGVLVKNNRGSYKVAQANADDRTPAHCAAPDDGSPTKKRLEQWVRDDPSEGMGGVGGLPDGLSFARGGASSKIYKRLLQQFRRAQGLSRDLRTGDRAYYYQSCADSWREREERRKQFEIWVRNNTKEGMGAKGALPDGLSFGKGGTTSKIYQRLNRQFLRALGRRNKDMTEKELHDRHIAEELKYAERELECESQVASAVYKLTDADLLRELTARGLSAFDKGHLWEDLSESSKRAARRTRLETAVSAAAAAAAAAKIKGAAFARQNISLYSAFYAGFMYISYTGPADKMQTKRRNLLKKARSHRQAYSAILALLEQKPPPAWCTTVIRKFRYVPVYNQYGQYRNKRTPSHHIHRWCAHLIPGALYSPLI